MERGEDSEERLHEAVAFKPKSRTARAAGLLLSLIPARRRSVREHLAVLRRSTVVEQSPSLSDCFRFHALYYWQLWRAGVGIDLRPDAATEKCVLQRSEHGRLILTVHVGPWDAAAKWLIDNGACKRLYVVGRPQRMRFIDSWLARRRSVVGAHVVWSEDRKQVGRRCAGLLEAGETVVLFIDRDYWIATPANALLFDAPTRLADELASEILPFAGEVVFTVSYFTGSADGVLASVPVCIPDDVGLGSLLRTLTEDAVRVAPAQWHMFSRRWLS